MVTDPIPMGERRFTLNGTPIELDFLVSLGVMDLEQMAAVQDLEAGHDLPLGRDGTLAYFLRRVA